MMNTRCLIRLPEMFVDLEVGKVYFVGHDNPLVITRYFIETIVSNFEKRDPINNGAFRGLEYFIDDKYVSLQRLRSGGILDTNQMALAISIESKSTDEFIEMLYNDVKTNKHKIVYVLIDSFTDLIFRAFRGDLLIMDVDRTLSDISKIAFEFKIPIVLGIPTFYPASRKLDYNMPLITKIMKSVFKLNARAFDSVSVKYSEPIIIYELGNKDLVDLPSGLLVDINTNLFEPL